MLDIPANLRKRDIEPTIPAIISYWSLLTDQHVVTREVLAYEYQGAGTENDPFRVAWISNDPRNPMQFSVARKIIIVLATGFATLVVSFTSSAYVGSLNEIKLSFDVGSEVAILGLSLFIMGFSLGPLIWAPLSETVGRQITFFFAFLMLASFSAACAGAQNIQSLLLLRFFAGAFGSAPLTNAGGVVSDMFVARQRSLALCLFAATPYLGPTLGPSMGGFLAMNAGWRWVQGFLAACAAFVWILLACLIPETYAPVLLRKRAKNLSKLTGKFYRCEIELGRPETAFLRRLKVSLSRPWVLLVHEPIVYLLTFYSSVVYGTCYMLFGAEPFIFETGRGWNPGVAGLPFLGIFIGTATGIIYIIVDNGRYIQTQKRHNGHAPPEARLPPCMVSAICIPVGLFWFAWTNSRAVHWVINVAALVPFGVGLMLVYTSIVNYLLDAYTLYSASVLASLSVVRYMFGAVFPLFATPMYKALGIHWATSIPAFVSLFCIPIPFLFYRYGALIRVKCRYAAESQVYAEKLQAAN